MRVRFPLPEPFSVVVCPMSAAPPHSPSPVAPPPPSSTPPTELPAPPRGSSYNLTNIFSSATTASLSSFSRAASSIPSSPCFRPSLQWGLVVGGVFGAHRLRVGAGAARAVGDAALVFGATVASQWFFCRREEHDRRLALRAYYDTQAALQAGGAVVGGGGSGGASAAVAVGGEGGDADTEKPAWRAELERLVKYELSTVEPSADGSEHPRGKGFTLR